MRVHAIAALLAACALGGWSCAKRGAEMQTMECEPVAEPAVEGVDAATLEGEYELTLVATEGRAAGTSARGTLSLYPNPPDLRGVESAGGGVRADATAPLYGATSVDPATVGGLDLGDPASRDAQAPGVLVVQRGNEIVLRLGAEANRRGVLRFDGGYFVLRVRRVTEDGFAGGWAGGTLRAQAAGHFCARRAGP
jgi:hypothetical protein